jgi:tetratricopeptide (TPR) repeat protein
MRLPLAIIVLTATVETLPIATLVPGLERAVLVGDVPTLERQREQLRALLAIPEHSGSSGVDYTLAYIDWRLTYLYHNSRQRERAARLDEARSLLEGLARINSHQAEVQALLGTVYGGLIDLHPWKAVALGPKAVGALAAAASAAPDNPRVALLNGVNALHTPKMFGGGLDVAERHLRRADALFAQLSDTAWPDWGRLDTLAWLGQVLQKKGDRDGALVAYERAWSIAPDYAWVKTVLLPAVNRPPARR